jgi:hypothetical protein
VLHLDISIQQEPVLHLDVSGLQEPLLHCKSGPHKNGIRKSSRKTYDNIMGIFRFEADIVIIKKEILISFFKYITAW